MLITRRDCPHPPLRGTLSPRGRGLGGGSSTFPLPFTGEGAPQGRVRAYEWVKVGRTSQRGFTLVMALFLVVVGALIVQFMLRMSAVQIGGNDLALQGARAWQAANAGAEWGVHQVTVSNSCAASTPVALGAASGLAGFTVTVTCNSTAYSEGGTPVTLYQIASSAHEGILGITPDYAYRQVQVTVARQP